MARIDAHLTAKIAQTLLYTKQTPLLIGESGIGKSDTILNLENTMADLTEKTVKVFVVQVNAISDRDTLYGPRPLEEISPIDGQPRIVYQFVLPQEIQSVIDYAYCNPDHLVLLNFDEVNRTDPDVTSALLSVPTTRTLATHTFPENVKFLATCNDRGNTSALDEASISRFRLFYLEPDAGAWMDYTHGQPEGLSEILKGVLSAHPDYIFIRPTEADTTLASRIALREATYGSMDALWQITTPRTLSALNAWLQSVDTETITSLSQTRSTVFENKSELYEELIGYTGPTRLTQKVHDELIGDDRPSQAEEDLVPQPQHYSEVITGTTQLTDLDDAERSQLLLYCLINPASVHIRLIQQLCEDRLWDQPVIHSDWASTAATCSVENLYIPGYLALVTNANTDIATSLAEL